MKSEIYVLRAELREVVDPVLRQRVARDIATLEARLLARGVEV
jgi:hypothetical protein